MSSVSARTPWGEPPIWPSGGAGGGAGVGAAARAVVTVGSSLSLGRGSPGARGGRPGSGRPGDWSRAGRSRAGRSEEHTSELQSLAYLVCRLLLEKKKTRDTQSSLDNLYCTCTGSLS